MSTRPAFPMCETQHLSDARSQVIASKEESKNHWQQKDYKGFNSSTDWDTADFSKVRLFLQSNTTYGVAHAAREGTSPFQA